MIGFSILNQNQIPEYVNGINKAFQNRSGERIHFKHIKTETIEQELKEGCVHYGLFRNQEIIGGATIKESGEALVTISHVWILPAYQGKGYSKCLLKFLEEDLSEHGVKYIVLGVASCYEPAVNLYRKNGFRPIGITANEPNTYYFIDMVKTLEPEKFFEIKRTFCYIISQIKFYLLFDKYSCPNIIHRYIYKNK